MIVSTDLLFVRPNALTVTSNMESCDIISKAIERYKPIFFPPALEMRAVPADVDNVLQELRLNIKGNQTLCEKYIDMNSNEACKYERCKQRSIDASTYL